MSLRLHKTQTQKNPPARLSGGGSLKLEPKDAYMLSLPVPEDTRTQHERRQQRLAGLWQQIVMAAAYAENDFPDNAVLKSGRMLVQTAVSGPASDDSYSTRSSQSK